MFYPPSALFVVGFGAVLLILFRFSIVISQLTEQNRRLAQYLALLDWQLRQARSDPVPVSTDHPAPDSEQDMAHKLEAHVAIPKFGAFRLNLLSMLQFTGQSGLLMAATALASLIAYLLQVLLAWGLSVGGFGTFGTLQSLLPWGLGLMLVVVLGGPGWPRSWACLSP